MTHFPAKKPLDLMAYRKAVTEMMKSPQAFHRHFFSNFGFFG
jgi:hypothetical protein